LAIARRLARNGLEAYAVARRRGLEGLVAKEAGSAYVSARSRAWLKVKIRQEDEFVIGGYTSPAGSREHLGALLLGAYDAERQFVYVGRVGTGFTRPVLADMARRLRPWVRHRTPFVNPPRAAGVTWVAPHWVAQIAFHEWTQDGKLRQPAFLGLRTDKPARAVQLAKGRP
jgi:ATP-dependent DNA ligase